MTNRSAILAVPGLSTTTLLTNIANIMDRAGSRTPVVLVDKYDYERLRGRHIKGIGENQKAPYLGMIYDDLRRRGIIRLVDYSKYYPKQVQQQYLQQIEKLIGEMPEWLHQQMAVRGVELWLIYGRGPYQEPVRAALGEGEDTFAASRRKDQGLLRKLKRGGGDPVAWNRKLLNKSVAALEIRHQTNKNMRLDVECIVAGPEHEIIGDLLRTARSSNSDDLDLKVLDIAPNDITTEVPHSKGSDPLHSIEGIDPEMNANTRSMFDTVTEVAEDIVGREGDKWVILGPPLVIPQYSEMFDADRIQAQVNGGMDAAEIATQTSQVINTLNGDTEENHPSGPFRYEADRVMEEHNSSSVAQNENVESLINQAISTSNYSVELKSLIDDNNISQAAIFTAAGILSDPIHRYDENDIYRYSLDLAARLNFSNVADAELKRVGLEASATTWGRSPGWVDDVNQRQ